MGTKILGYLPIVEAERIPLGSSSVSQRLSYSTDLLGLLCHELGLQMNAAMLQCTGKHWALLGKGEDLTGPRTAKGK